MGSVLANICAYKGFHTTDRHSVCGGGLNLTSGGTLGDK